MKPDKIYHDKNWLEEQYWHNGLSTYKIAVLASVTQMTIHNWMCKHRIPRRTHSEAIREAWLQGGYKEHTENMKEAWKTGRFSNHAEAISQAHARGVYSITDSMKKKIAEGVHRAWQRGDYDCNKGSRHYAWTGGPESIQCETCNITFQDKVSRTRRFCSKPCYGVWLSKNITGEKNPLWRGGISLEPYSADFNNRFKRMIRKRDNFTCAVCRLQGWCVHHIDYDKNNTIAENCITLCDSCHGVTNSNRNYWQPALSQIMLARSSLGAIA